MKGHSNKVNEDMLELKEKILGLGEKSLRKNYYPELQTRKEKLESILRAAPVGIGIFVKDIIVEVNNTLCNMMGYREEEIVGKKIEFLFASKEDYEYTQNKKLKGLIKEQIITAETKWKKKNGEIMIILLSFSPLDAKDFSKGITFTVFEITDRKKAEETIFFEKERLKITLESIGDGVVSTDKEGKIVLINAVAEKLTGWTEKEAKGRNLDEVFNIIGEKGNLGYDNPVATVLSTGITMGLTDHMTLLSKKGTERIIAHTAAPIKDQNCQIQGVVLVFRDITEERKRQEEIIRLSYYDRLTGLYNRSYFEEAIRTLDTERQLPLSIIIGDINGLKLTNDVFGHQEGDQLLKSAAMIMKTSCREEDIVARWGGDEFIILMPQTSEIEAKKIIEDINLKCQKDQDQKIKTSISLGYASKTKPEEDIMQLLKKAEDIMYQHKLLESHSLRSAIISSIRNTLCEKSHETEEHAERLKEISRRIGKAMEISELQLYELELLAVLHDIGKIAINDNILNKPGKLTEEEWEEMKRHPEIGYRIVQAVPELSQIAEYILTHHERWDGRGYPRRIKGNDIPLLSRILAVADAYDAITTDRPYQKALPKSVAIEELLQNAGTQFDPLVVKNFIEKVVKQLS